MDERYAISRYEQAVLLLPPKWQRLARQLPDHQKVLAEELRLTGEQELAGTELLVAGHHGSAYASAPQLLAELGGDTAVISVGYNSYGHPAEETLERLALCGYNIYRTDKDGTVEIRIG